MGVIPSLEFVPSDYKIKYADPGDKSRSTGHKEYSALIGHKSLRIVLSKSRTEIIKLPHENLTVKWLLGEITNIYEWLKETGKLGNVQDKYIVGLKTIEGLISMDYYLTNLNNSLNPIKENTLLTVQYSKVKNLSSGEAQKEKVNK